MKIIMRSAVVSLIGLAMLLSVTGPAQAQAGYAPSPPLIGPGNIGNAPDLLSGEAGSSHTPQGTAFALPVVAAPAGAGGGDSELAFTGAESRLLAAAGVTMLLVGGGAVIVSRKREG